MVWVGFLSLPGCAAGNGQSSLPSSALQPCVRRPARVARKRVRGTVHMSSETPPRAKSSVLFVCLGNICRSPTAEALFSAAVSSSAIPFRVDSCGTGGGSSNWYRPGGFSYHEGEESDARMRRAAAARGVEIRSVSRPLRPRDLLEFEYVVGMDAANVEAVKEAARFWGDAYAAAAETKVVRMLDFVEGEAKGGAVPDPYYGGPDGFERVMDLLEEACTGLLNHIERKAGN
mmetsp:Transcript_5186/g.12664  ORF Transcript_5186/g.12664 Transcript_5186/m.12664 type:complete len:231 (-) Transcript_5186:128-820(-)